MYINESLYFSIPDIESMNIEIYHCSGSLIFKRKIRLSEGELILPTGHIFHTEGIYFYVIKTANGIMSGRIEALKR